MPLEFPHFHHPQGRQKSGKDFRDVPFVPVPVGIRSIRTMGFRPTWQIVMPGPLHNYVLGGVVSANSHAVAYGEIAYRMAWVKAHYPAQFWAAFLTHEDDLDGTLGPCLAAARRQGVTVLPPDINLSLVAFTSGPGILRCGLGVVRGIGKNLGDEIIAARQDGPFRSVADFIRRVPAAGRRIPMTNLILSGALDAFPGTRPEKLACLAEFSGRGVGPLIHGFQGISGGTKGGTGSFPPIPSPVETDWSVERKLDGEREATGDYLTGHPLGLYRPVLSATGVRSLAETDGFGSGRAGGILMAGIVRHITHRKTRRGGMVVLTVDDETASRTATLSGTAWTSLRHVPQKGDRIVLRVTDMAGGSGGRTAPVSSGAPGLRLGSRLQVAGVVGLNDYLSGLSEIHLPVGMAFSGWELNRDETPQAALDALTARYPGHTRLRITFTDGVCREASVTCCRELILALRELLPDGFRESGGITGSDFNSGVAIASAPPELTGGTAGLLARPSRPPAFVPYRGRVG